MPEIVEKLKEPFNLHMNERLSLLDSATEQIETHKDTINNWPSRKKRLTSFILDPLKKQTSFLKRMTRPFNLKQFNKEKGRMNRSFFFTKLKYSFLSSGKILRILLFLVVLFGIVFLLVWLLGKVIGSFDIFGKIEW